MPALAGLAVLFRLPLVGLPPGPDEAGLLMLAGQWGPGRSLYGAYWVDRPPLLIDVFAIAAHLGGPGDGGVVALRLVGLVLVAGSVLLAGLIGRLLGHPVAAAALAAVLLCQPLFGVLEVDGEIVALPVVLAGIAALVAALRTRSGPTAGWLLVATGACATAAALVKQNEIDVFVLVVAALPQLRRVGALSVRRALGATLLGALVAGVVVLGGAALRGTSPVGLWEAVVGFRFQASRIIAGDTPSATADRLHHLLWAAVLVGVPLLGWRWLRDVTRPRGDGEFDLRLATTAVLGWETLSVLGGGSYWHHYLICLVPGLVLVEAQLRPGRRRSHRRLLRIPAVGVLAVLCAWPLALTYRAAADGTPPDPTVTWLRGHVRPGDTGLVAFGHADILYGAGLSSPYPELWSLPVRVRDPHLHRLGRILESPRRPTWVVTGPGGTLSSWGLEAAGAQEAFRLGYDEVADLGATRVFHVRSGT